MKCKAFDTFFPQKGTDFKQGNGKVVPVCCCCCTSKFRTEILMSRLAVMERVQPNVEKPHTSNPNPARISGTWTCAALHFALLTWLSKDNNTGS
jgi:hypothetical protein